MTRAGEEIRVELSLVPLEATVGTRGPYVLAMLRDASDHKRAELHALEAARADAARLDAERRLRDQSHIFGRGLADLGQPLARLRRSVTRLARLSARADEGRAALMARVVHRRTDQLHAALRQLADVSAMRTGQLQLHPERVNLVPLIARTTSRFRDQSTCHRINVALPQGLTALIDEARIEQVLEALLEEALRRNPRGCWIDVDLRRPLVGLAEIVVRDYGRAVAEPEQQRLLEGSAIALCRWLVAQHGGTLSFEAPAEGGLRAVVTLPTQRGRVSGA
jgi:K+-sensing histidine kinase KdpD